MGKIDRVASVPTGRVGKNRLFSEGLYLALIILLGFLFTDCFVFGRVATEPTFLCMCSCMCHNVSTVQYHPRGHPSKALFCLIVPKRGHKTIIHDLVYHLNSTTVLSIKLENDVKKVDQNAGQVAHQSKSYGIVSLTFANSHSI